MADFVFGIIIVFMLALFLAGIVLVFWFILDVTDILKRIEAYRLSKQYQKEIASAIKSYKKGGKTMLRNLIFWFLSKEQKERHECREILAKAEFEFE
jgi:biopolymer transport protein ExbB/TolQ